ncbi:MAG: hypothetical protein OXI05_03225 [Bacteroidota bacterium]|nr:hypothetical protein [Bacteroidota bacterium]
MGCAVNGSGEAQGIDLGMSLGAEEHTCSSRARSLVRYPKLRLHRRYWSGSSPLFSEIFHFLF